jgi:hypothetical protein
MVRLFGTYKLTKQTIHTKTCIPTFDDHVQEHRIKFSSKPLSNLPHLQGSTFIPKPISMFGSDPTSFFQAYIVFNNVFPPLHFKM